MEVTKISTSFYSNLECLLCKNKNYLKFDDCCGPKKVLLYCENCRECLAIADRDYITLYDRTEKLLKILRMVNIENVEIDDEELDMLMECIDENNYSHVKFFFDKHACKVDGYTTLDALNHSDYDICWRHVHMFEVENYKKEIYYLYFTIIP
jgi:hypothetical protein